MVQGNQVQKELGKNITVKRGGRQQPRTWGEAGTHRAVLSDRDGAEGACQVGVPGSGSALANGRKGTPIGFEALGNSRARQIQR